VTQSSVTRGHGLLERFLAKRRAARAERLIPPAYRTGCILDIGCGSWPYFLSRTAFAAKIGVDKVVRADRQAGVAPGIRLVSFDVHENDALPLNDGAVDVVTMLAVFEHIRVDRLTVLLNEVERVLKPGGVFVMTTPSGWTGPILEALKRLKMVSADEINEHQDSYSLAKIRAVLAGTRLAGMPAEFGYFELGMNIWARVSKPVLVHETIAASIRPDARAAPGPVRSDP
jgi:SAM-dependent methyltransferase